ncbi:MAG TPA: hypothetical protein VK638_24480 [Edaphobacter sp.]|nr:hypothetical protein [Edaphobacter sp.]
MPQPKPKKVGRPKLAKGEAKGHVVVVRLTAEDHNGSSEKFRG